MGGTIYLSASAAEGYDRCPWMSYLQYVCNYEPPPTLQKELGIACHTFIAGLHRPHTDALGIVRSTGPKYSVKNLNQQWITHWVKHLKKVRGNPSAALLSEIGVGGMQKGPEYIRKYLEYPRIMEIGPDMVEVRLPGSRIEGSSVVVSTRIDQLRHPRIGNGDLIVDLKFSPGKEYDIHTNLALKLYALGYRQHFKRRESGVVIWNVANTSRHNLWTGAYTDAELEEAKIHVGHIGRAIIRRAWNLPNSALCATCRQAPVCMDPGKSEELQQLARKNSGYDGRLPRTRSGLLRERMLEPKPIIHSSQPDLFVDPRDEMQLPF